MVVSEVDIRDLILSVGPGWDRFAEDLTVRADRLDEPLQE